MGEGRLDCPDCGASLKYVPGFDYLMCLECTTAPEATGPQRSDSGAPNPETNLVTVELTRAELDRLELAWMEFNQPFAEFEWEPIDDGIAAKFRASLERTSK